MKSRGAGALSIVLDDGLEDYSKILVGHGLVVTVSFFFNVSVEFGLEADDVLGNVAQMMESVEIDDVVLEGVVYRSDCFVVKRDVSQFEGGWWKGSVMMGGEVSGGERGERHGQQYFPMVLKGSKPRLGKRKKFGSLPCSKAILISSRSSRISYTSSRQV
jgi:hypothetical protein